MEAKKLPTPKEIAEACKDFLAQEDLDALAGMSSSEEAIEFTCARLSQLGIDQPHEFLSGFGITVLTSQDVANACIDVLPKADFSLVAGMPTVQAAYSMACTLLTMIEVDDPEAFLKAKGILI